MVDIRKGDSLDVCEHFGWNLTRLRSVKKCHDLSKNQPLMYSIELQMEKEAKYAHVRMYKLIPLTLILPLKI